MKKEEILEAVIEIIAEKTGFETEEIDPAHFLRDDLGMDSLDFVETIIELENRFGVEIPEDEADVLEKPTVGALIEYLCRMFKLE